MKIMVRQHTPSDIPFIAASYLKNHWYSKDNQTTLRKATWMKLHHQRLEGLLRASGCLIACLDEDPDQILGYSLKDGQRVFTYVKLAYRSPGLKIKELLENKQ